MAEINYCTLSLDTILTTIRTAGTPEEAAASIWTAVEEAISEARSDAYSDAIREYEERM